MKFKGKVVAGIIGLFVGDALGIFLGGLTGFLIGTLIGHFFFDRPFEAQSDQQDDYAYRERQRRFLFFVMAICAKVAKCDGPINHAEKNRIDRLMRDKFRLNDAGRKYAIQIWNHAKDNAEPNIDRLCREFFQEFSRDRIMVNSMIDYVFAIAAADQNRPTPAENHVLRNITRSFGVSQTLHDRFMAYHFEPPRASKGAAYSTLDPHYLVLDASPNDTVDVIKKKFRKLALQWHPDRLTAEGASPEALRHAKEKFQRINEAYNTILDARKG